MKTSFFAYFRPTEEEFDRLWADCLFTFDTNILRNLYRYKENAKDEFISIFKNPKFCDRLFLTNQVGLEFARGRAEAISEQIKAYTSLSSDIDKILSVLSNKNRHPHLSDTLSDEFVDIIQRVKSEIPMTIEKIKSKYSKDDILDGILEIFDGKVSERFDESQLDCIYAEGEKRYENRIPPGYKDGIKNGDKKYGDLVVWKQIISYINLSKKDVILVIDDVKEDWWLNHEGMKNPHPKLIEEFHKETGQKIYFYTSDMFLRHASGFINSKVSEEVISEVVEIREDSSRQGLIENYFVQSRSNYAIISEEELMDKLLFFSKNVIGSNGYIGLKRFITEFLANQDYEINHSYAIINNLVEKNLISISTKFDDALGYNVKVVELIK